MFPVNPCSVSSNHPPRHLPPTLCHHARGTECFRQELIQGHWGDAQGGQFSACCIQRGLNCTVVAGELLRTPASTQASASCLEIVWKRRQTSQLSEEPHSLKLPSTAISRPDQTEALEASQWCQASPSASLANSSWCQQRNKTLFNWGCSRMETVPPCCRALPKRCSGGLSKGTRLEGMCYSWQTQAPVRETSQPTGKHVFIFQVTSTMQRKIIESVFCVCLHLHSAVMEKGNHQAHAFV